MYKMTENFREMCKRTENLKEMCKRTKNLGTKVEEGGVLAFISSLVLISP